MAKEKTGRRNLKRQTAKVPLTYYRSAKATEPSDSPFEKRPSRSRGKGRKFLIGILDIIMIGLTIVGLVYALLVKPSPTVSLNSTAYHSKQVYVSAATNLFQKLKNRNKVTLNEQAIVNALQRQFPEVANGSVELPLFSETPVVRLNISAPAFKLKTQNNSYIVDRQGVAVAMSAELPGIKGLPTILDQSGFMADAGKQVISADAVDFINTLLVQCRHANVVIASLNLPPKAQELDLTAKDQPYFVKFYLGGNPLIQAGQFLAARHQFATGGTQPSEYLDVRVPGKVFFK